VFCKRWFLRLFRVLKLLSISRGCAIIFAYSVRVDTVLAAVFINTRYEFELTGRLNSEVQLEEVVGLAIAIILFCYTFPAFPLPIHYENRRLNGQLSCCAFGYEL